MEKKLSNRCFFSILLIIIFSFISVKFVMAANFPLEIISPRNSLDPNNRVLWACPGIEYNIRCSAIRGIYPYTWKLIITPTGMTINAYTGEIKWIAAASGKHNVTLPKPLRINQRDFFAIEIDC